ncbi:MAG TPA: hypothetical protein VJX23_16780 [Candidatus Binataceae bacterium]|nr:hypothetical protein [Candidatus Binataceae bacterium]
MSDGPGLPGFWFGFLPGIISPLSLLGGLFCTDRPSTVFPQRYWFDEPHLLSERGESYAQYCGRVARWLGAFKPID